MHDSLTVTTTEGCQKAQLCTEATAALHTRTSAQQLSVNLRLMPRLLLVIVTKDIVSRHLRQSSLLP